MVFGARFRFVCCRRRNCQLQLVSETWNRGCGDGDGKYGLWAQMKLSFFFFQETGQM